MTNQVLFVHGGGEGAHEEDLKLVKSLRDKLGANYIVHYPMMPNEADPDYEAWKKAIADELTSIGGVAILVGHSIGASVVIRIVVDAGIKPSIAEVFRSGAILA